MELRKECPRARAHSAKLLTKGKRTLQIIFLLEINQEKKVAANIIQWAMDFSKLFAGLYSVIDVQLALDEWKSHMEEVMNSSFVVSGNGQEQALWNREVPVWRL